MYYMKINYFFFLTPFRSVPPTLRCDGRRVPRILYRMGRGLGAEGPFRHAVDNGVTAAVHSRAAHNRDAADDADDGRGRRLAPPGGGA